MAKIAAVALASPVTSLVATRVIAVPYQGAVSLAIDPVGSEASPLSLPFQMLLLMMLCMLLVFDLVKIQALMLMEKLDHWLDHWF